MSKAGKLKLWFKKISMETYKYPEWKDICREELLKDFDFESKDDEKLKDLKQQFCLVKTKFYNEYLLTHLVFFCLRLYNLFIFSFIFYPFMSLFVSGDVITQQGGGVFSLLLLTVSFIFLRFVYKYPYALINRLKHHAGVYDYVQDIITTVKEVKKIKLMNQNLFIKDSISFPFSFLPFDLFGIFICLHFFLGLEQFTFNFLSDPKGLYILAQICLVIFPSFFKWRYLRFSFKSLFIREQIQTNHF